MARSFLLLVLSAVVATAPAQTVPDAITGQRVACTDGTAAGYACTGVDLMAFLPRTDFGAGSLNDIWGWVDPTDGREYALVGLNNGTAFVDVTDAVNPVHLGTLPTHTTATSWRDVKVYADHAFVVSEATDHGLQVFDLTQLRDVDRAAAPVTFEETAYYDGFGRAHNVVINEDTGFLYGVGSRPLGTPSGPSCGPGLHMVDIQDPADPTFAGCFDDHGYTHDAQCVVYQGPDADYLGQEICIGSNVNVLSVADVTDKQNPVPIATGSYPTSSYIHQGWFTEDQRYFFLNDELDQGPTRTLVFDLTDLDDPQLLTEFIAETTSQDHNLYVVGNYVFQANYTAGLRILEFQYDDGALDPASLREVALFDTFPQSDARGYSGLWSVYPFFPSGNVVASDIGGGLFVLQPTAITTAVDEEPAAVPAGFALAAAYPNPFNPQTTVMLAVDRAQPIRVAVYDALGREVARLHEGPLAAGTHR
ncbi:MAG: choice-of-anchor B family protein, partial [Rhodothermales bacterium]|nr:choice-of-anchor B family protein [Rhodothermales bacterium]